MVKVALSPVQAPDRRGMSKYIKKKALDPIEGYLPPVLQARKQLVKSGEIMGVSRMLPSLLSSSSLHMLECSAAQWASD